MLSMALLTIVAVACPEWSQFSDLASTAIASMSYPLKRPLWRSIYTNEFAHAAAAADQVFASYYMQPDLCEEGFVLSTIFRLIPFAIADREGWVERFNNVLNQYESYMRTSILVKEYWQLVHHMREPIYSPIEQGIIIGTIRAYTNLKKYQSFTTISDACLTDETVLVVASHCHSQPNCVPILLPVRLPQLKYLLFLAGIIGTTNLNLSQYGTVITDGFVGNECVASEMLAWIDRNPFPVEHQGLEAILAIDSSKWIEQYTDEINTSYMNSSNTCKGLVLPTHENTRIVPKLNITVINYASGCCWEAQKKNSETALRAGATAVHALNRSNLDPTWANTASVPTSRGIGGGYWVWKPRIILDQLEKMQNGDILVYLDAGNFFNLDSDLNKLVFDVLNSTDVAAPFLPCCLESDWTKQDVFHALQARGVKFTDTPQIGAFFIIFRKSSVAVNLVIQWLNACMHPHNLNDSESLRRNHPTFVKHTHDQSLFSIIFKKFGFLPFPLKKAEMFVTLARWRN